MNVSPIKKKIKNYICIKEAWDYTDYTYALEDKKKKINNLDLEKS